MLLGDWILYVILVLISIGLWFLMIIDNQEIELVDIILLLLLFIVPGLYLFFIVFSFLIIVVLDQDCSIKFINKLKNYMDKLNKKIFKK
jgi:hypothetical protein